MLDLKPKKQIYIGKINTSERELKDLLKAWLAISFAFGIVMRGFPQIAALQLNLIEIFLVAGITVGLGFLLHELGHKFVAQRYGCFAEFRSFDQMLVLAVLMSFFGFVFAAPGAVMILGPVGKRRNGVISAAGPIVNLLLALVFLALLFASPTGFVLAIAMFGFFVNSWLALFNMIPFWNFDGAKIWRWNKPVYWSIVAIAISFLFIQNFV